VSRILAEVDKNLQQTEHEVLQMVIETIVLEKAGQLENPSQKEKSAIRKFKISLKKPLQGLLLEVKILT
jgi:hypothetical protein